MITRPITEKELNLIFERESVLIGTENNIPTSRAILYFGADAIEFAKHFQGGGGKTCNNYGLGNRGISCEYLTLKGLKVAATYRNIVLIDEEAATE